MAACLWQRGETTRTPLVSTFPLKFTPLSSNQTEIPFPLLDGLARIVREEGVLTLWKGWGPNFNRAMFMTASQVATYDQFKQMLLASG